MSLMTMRLCSRYGSSVVVVLLALPRSCRSLTSTSTSTSTSNAQTHANASSPSLPSSQPSTLEDLQPSGTPDDDDWLRLPRGSSKRDDSSNELLRDLAVYQQVQQLHPDRAPMPKVKILTRNDKDRQQPPIARPSIAAAATASSNLTPEQLARHQQIASKSLEERQREYEARKQALGLS